MIKWVGLILLFLPLAAGASRGDTYITNNYYPTETTIISGMSDTDINALITGTLAGGSHQFDFSTTNWQLSLTGAVNMSDWDEDSNFSFAVGKRFGKDSKIPNALWHVSYTPIEDDDYVVFGGTIVLD